MRQQPQRGSPFLRHFLIFLLFELGTRRRTQMIFTGTQHEASFNNQKSARGRLLFDEETSAFFLSLLFLR